jgi:hypothetical protein
VRSARPDPCKSDIRKRSAAVGAMPSLGEKSKVSIVHSRWRKHVAGIASTWLQENEPTMTPTSASLGVTDAEGVREAMR